MKTTTAKPICIVLALSLILGCLCGCGSTTATTMHLKKFLGTVGVVNGKDTRLEPREGMQLYSGYEVGTAQESLAWISLDEYKAVKLDQLSTGEVQKDGKHLTLKLHEGKLFFNVTKPLEEDETLVIETATMVTGIRGTSGWVEVIDANTVQLALLEGTVEATSIDPKTNEARQTSVTGGQIITVVYYGSGEKPRTEDEAIGQLIDNGTITEDHIIRTEEGLRVEQLQEKKVPEFVADEVAQSEELQQKIEEKSDLSVPIILDNQSPSDPQPPTPAGPDPNQPSSPGDPSEPQATPENPPQDTSSPQGDGTPDPPQALVPDADGNLITSVPTDDGIERIYTELEDGTKMMEEYGPDGSYKVYQDNGSGTWELIGSFDPPPDPPAMAPSISQEWYDSDGNHYLETIDGDGTVTTVTTGADGSVTTRIEEPNGNISENYQAPEGTPDPDILESGSSDSADDNRPPTIDYNNNQTVNPSDQNTNTDTSGANDNDTSGSDPSEDHIDAESSDANPGSDGEPSGSGDHSDSSGSMDLTVPADESIYEVVDYEPPEPPVAMAAPEEDVP